MAKRIDLLNLFVDVCKYYGLEQSDVLSKSRKAELVNARAVFSYIAYNLWVEEIYDGYYVKSWSYSALGRFLYRKHETIMHSVKNVVDEIRKNNRVLEDDIYGILAIRERVNMVHKFEKILKENEPLFVKFR